MYVERTCDPFCSTVARPHSEQCPFLGNICTSKGCQEPGWERQPWWCEAQNPQMRNGSGYWAEVLMVFLQIIKGLTHEEEEYILPGCPIHNKGQLVNLPGSHISNQPGEKLQAIRNVWFWNGLPYEMSFLPWVDTVWKGPNRRGFPREDTDKRL